MPRLFIPAERLQEKVLRPTRAELRHLRAMRIRSGTRICVFDDQGAEYEAVVRHIGPRGAEIEIGGRLAPAPHAHVPLITLIAAILKGQRMDTLVEKSTELGIDRIIPMVTELTIARPERGTDRIDRWRRLAVSAATQCGRRHVPVVAEPALFADALEARQGGLGILMWESERAVTLPAIRKAEPAPLTISVAVGPEGGFTDAEVDMARAAGFIVSGLGPRTLRAETAAIAAVTLCQATWGDLAGHLPDAHDDPGT